MTEIELLRSMWAPKIRRSVKLIVPHVTDIDGKGSLNNGHWAYRVSFAFRDALDIKLMPRKKDGKSYMTWTQGVIVNFKEGDLLYSRRDTSVLQVKYANSMGWDSSKNEMSTGSVTYEEFDGSHQPVKSINVKTITQMDFLEMLIYGKYCY